MEYKIRQKYFSLGDSFSIKDMHDKDLFIVQAKIFSFGNKLKIFNLAGEELVYIEQKLFKFMPEYHIYMNNRQVAMIKKEFTFFKPKLFIQSDIGRFEVDGNIFGYDFNVLKNGKVVARITKKIFSWTDSYQAYIDDYEDQALMLALVIVIDQVFHDNNSNNG